MLGWLAPAASRRPNELQGLALEPVCFLGLRAAPDLPGRLALVRGRPDVTRAQEGVVRGAKGVDPRHHRLASSLAVAHVGDWRRAASGRESRGRLVQVSGTTDGELPTTPPVCCRWKRAWPPWRRQTARRCCSSHWQRWPHDASFGTTWTRPTPAAPVPTGRPACSWKPPWAQPRQGRCRRRRRWLLTWAALWPARRTAQRKAKTARPKHRRPSHCRL